MAFLGKVNQLTELSTDINLLYPEAVTLLFTNVYKL